MKFLSKLYLYLKRFFQGTNASLNVVTIPPEIGGDELIVRGIVHPLFYSFSKNKLSDKSFLPPPVKDRNDVSVLRHDYTDTNQCKAHVKNNVKIGGSEYCGLAIVQAKNVEEVNSMSNLFFDNGEKLSVSIKATPLDNLAIHSDILYSHSVIVDEPNTLMRKLAKSLRDKSKYLHDPNPKHTEWKGEEINVNLFQ